MATARTVRWCSSSSTKLSALSTLTPFQPISKPQNIHRRTFLSNPLGGPQVLTATRTVPYPASLVYTIISDVSSYSSFLPFCSDSTVTRHSSPDANGRTWPEEASLAVGFNNDISESFASRVYCQPERFVEAVSGPQAESSISPSDVPHHSPRSQDTASDPTRKGAVLSHLRTRWELRPFPFRPGPLRAGESPIEKTGDVPAQQQTEVILGIEYAFANPIYGAMSKAVAPKIAEYMIEAFEKRIRDVVHRPADGTARVIKG